MTEQAFQQSVASCGEDCEYTVDWWTRGGEPGPGYTSDKLTVTVANGFARATYVKSRFDPAYEGNFRALQYTSAINRSEADAFLRALEKDEAFSRYFAGEDRLNLADGIKDTVGVHFADQSYEKTMVESEAADLANAKVIRNGLAGRLEQAGRGTDLNRKLR
jgi:hypothetical protein